MRWGAIPVQFPFITYGMELYINDSIPTNTITLSKCMCMRASELRTSLNVYILKLLFLSIFCRHIENKPWLNFIWGGGGQAPPSPPHQYASDHCTKSIPALIFHWTIISNKLIRYKLQAHQTIVCKLIPRTWNNVTSISMEYTSHDLFLDNYCLYLIHLFLSVDAEFTVVWYGIWNV